LEHCALEIADPHERYDVAAHGAQQLDHGRLAHVDGVAEWCRVVLVLADVDGGAARQQ